MLKAVRAAAGFGRGWAAAARRRRRHRRVAAAVGNQTFATQAISASDYKGTVHSNLNVCCDCKTRWPAVCRDADSDDNSSNRENIGVEQLTLSSISLSHTHVYINI